MSNRTRRRPVQRILGCSGLLRRRNADRRGAAAVELAVVAPLFIFLIFATVEIARMFMVQHMILNASREGARTAVADSATSEEIEERVEEFLEDNGIEGATVTADKNSESVRVSVSIPYADVTWIPSPEFLRHATLEASTKMRTEGPG